jgi:hypothetical protein
MKRRGLFALLGAVPLLGLVTPARATRYSCLEDDPGYAAWRRLIREGSNVRVFFDGREIDVITADSREGWVLVYRTDDEGKPLLNEAKDEILKERIYGHVRIEIARDRNGRRG